MTFPLHVHSQEGLIISIDGGGFLDQGATRPGEHSRPQQTRSYSTHETKSFTFDFDFKPVLLISGALWAVDGKDPKLIHPISSRIPNLNELLKASQVNNLQGFVDTVAGFALRDSWGVNGSGLKIFISGLTSANNKSRHTTFNLTSSNDFIPTMFSYALNQKQIQYKVFNWTFPASDETQQYCPDLAFMERIFLNEKSWVDAYPDVKNELVILSQFIKPYLIKVNLPKLEMRGAPSQLAIEFSFAVQAVAQIIATRNLGLDVHSPVKSVGPPITLYELNSRKKTLRLVSADDLPHELKKYL